MAASLEQEDIEEGFIGIDTQVLNEYLGNSVVLHLPLLRHGTCFVGAKAFELDSCYPPISKLWSSSETSSNQATRRQGSTYVVQCLGKGCGWLLSGPCQSKGLYKVGLRHKR